MAWFGEIKNITGNLTGQLSNVANTAASFTRDVLAEGTEEVDDQVTELKIAQNKIRELEAVIIAQRSENERLNTLTHELEDKAEASELQINTISHQYRTVLQEKHDELSVLKQQQQAMQDMQQSMLAAATEAGPAPASVSASITHSTSTSSLSGSLVPADDHDFGDVIASQHEINRLSNEVSRLRTECGHWKQMASVTSQAEKTGPMFEIGLDQDTPNSNTEEILHLKNRIKELEHDLSREIDESQRELAALQDAHSQKLATLGLRHKQEVADYVRRLEQLELGPSAGDATPSSPPSTPVHSPDGLPPEAEAELQTRVKELQEALRVSKRSFGQLDESCKRLRSELEQVKQVEKEKTRTADLLRRQVEALKVEKEKGNQENETLRSVRRDLAGQLDAERQENARLLEAFDRVKGQTEGQREEAERLRREEVAPLREKLSEMEKELDAVRAERDQASTSSTRHELHEARRKFTSEAMHQRSQLLKEKQALVNQMVDVGEQVSEGKSSVALLKATKDQMGSEAEDLITEMGGSSGRSQEEEREEGEAGETEEGEGAEDQPITPNLLQALEAENRHLRQKLEALEALAGRPDPKAGSWTGSQGTLELTGDSETESHARLQLAEADLNQADDVRRVQCRRPTSPSSSSAASTASTAAPAPTTLSSESEGAAARLGPGPGRSYPTSDSEVPTSQTMESSDNISFDGEYDDSIMFSGIKQRFPEAAHAFQEQMEHFELIRSDWDMEKQALEEVVVRMREQLKEKDSELQSLTAQKGLQALDSQQLEQLEEDIETLQDTVEKMEEEHTQMEQEKVAISREKEALQTELEKLQEEQRRDEETGQALSREVETLRERVSRGEEELRLRSEAAAEEVRSLEGRLREAQQEAAASARLAQERQEEAQSLREEALRETGDREADLLLLSQQHQQALDQVLQSRDQARQRAEELAAENAELLEARRELDSQLTELRSQGANYTEGLAELKEELNRRKAELTKLLARKGEEDQEISFLRDQLEEERTASERLREANMELGLHEGELKASVESLEKELHLVKERSQKMVSPEDKAQLDNSIADLEDRLRVAVSSGQEDKLTVHQLETRIRDLEALVDTLNEGKEKLDSALQESRERLQSQADAVEEKAQLLASHETEMTALREERENLRQELCRARQEHERTVSEMMQSSALDTGSLHSEHEKLIQLKNAKETEVMRLRSECEELQADLSGTKDMLNSTLDSHQQLAEIIKNKDADIRSLAEENSYFVRAVEEGKQQGKALQEAEARWQEVVARLEEAEARNVALASEAQTLRQDLREQLERSDVESKTLEVITELESEVGHLQKLLTAKEEEASRLEASLKERQEALAALEDNSRRQSQEMEQSQIRISSLESENGSLKEELAEALSNVRGLGEDLQKAQESKSTSHSEWLLERDAQILDLGKHLTSLKGQIGSQLQAHSEELSKKDAELSTMNDKLDKLNQELALRQRNAAEIKSEHDTELRQKNAQLDELKEKLSQLTRELNSQRATIEADDRSNGTIEEEVFSKREADLQNAKIESPTQSKRVGQLYETISESSLSDNEKHLENAVQEKEKELQLLRESNRSLEGLLEERSLAAMGNTMLVDLHKLQMQVRGYDSERSQMMTVLNEKTRDCSNLKSEVHRLVKVVSAQRTALEKAQEDSREIQRRLDEPRDDMQRQALQNLSRLIQDKDLEIEALTQKNDSLLQVLHSTAGPGDAGTDISRVLGESEQLQKENKMLKEERDQLVVSIHQKHQESLTYYEEVQRLAGVVTQETHKQADLQQRYNQVYADLDDKERSLSQLTLDVERRDSTLAALQKELEEKNQSFADMESQLADMNESLAQRDEELKESANVSQVQQDNEMLSALVRTKEEEIANLKVRLQTSPVQETPVVSEAPIRPEAVQLLSAPPPSEGALSRLEAEADQLREQLAQQTSALSDRDGALKSKQEELQGRLAELASLRQEVDRLNQAVLERDATLQLRSRQLHSAGEEAQARASELRGLQGKHQGLQSQLQGLRTENESLKRDGESLQHAVHTKDGEGRRLQDLANRLAAQLRERDFEAAALREKNQTLTALVQQREEGSSGELRRLLAETEAMQKQAQMFQQERDQALLALQRVQADMQALQTESQSSQEREHRLGTELNRLREHLLQVEEGYTREALQAEEREKELRTRLARAEEVVRSSSSAVHSASKEASSQIESLLDQLHTVTSQKEQALLQLGESQEQVQQYSTSLANLQMVLEQFTQEKEAAIAADVERYKVRAEEKSKISEQLFKQNVELQERLASSTEALEAASRLSEQLDRKEEAACQLREEISKKEELLHEYEARFDEIGSANQSKVDKPLMKNLLLGYFTAPQKKRQEVLKLLGSVLNFSHEDMQKVGAEQSPGWLSSIWGRGTPTNTPPSTPRKLALDNSFSEQFVKFLQQESSPAPKLRLPVEEMAQDKPRPGARPAPGPAFNPFSAPVPQYSPFIQQHRPAAATAAPGAGPTGDFGPHTLAAKAALPALPTFAPVAPTALPEASGRNSPARRPASEALKDILQ